jgi:hypothetical protein
MQTCEHPPLTGTQPVTGTPPLTGTPPVTGTPRRPGIRHHRLGRLVALAVGAFLLPWCAVLGATLPASAHVPNWSLAWVGLDLAEAVAALFTAVLLTRDSPRAGLPATAGAALLLADAWFDLCTSPPGLERLLAVGEAVLAELPLAAAAIWFAVALTRDTGRGRPEPGRDRLRGHDSKEEGRLGGRSWAIGRGTAPPRFGRDRRG